MKEFHPAMYDGPILGRITLYAMALIVGLVGGFYCVAILNIKFHPFILSALVSVAGLASVIYIEKLKTRRNLISIDNEKIVLSPAREINHNGEIVTSKNLTMELDKIDKITFARIGVWRRGLDVSYSLELLMKNNECKKYRLNGWNAVNLREVATYLEKQEKGLEVNVEFPKIPGLIEANSKIK